MKDIGAKQRCRNGVAWWFELMMNHKPILEGGPIGQGRSVCGRMARDVAVKRSVPAPTSNGCGTSENKQRLILFNMVVVRTGLLPDENV
jgi:hypothetical protein